MAEKRIQDFATVTEAQDDDLLLVSSNDETYNIKVKTLKDAVQGDADRAEAAAKEALATAKQVSDSVGNIEERASARRGKGGLCRICCKDRCAGRSRREDRGIQHGGHGLYGPDCCIPSQHGGCQSRGRSI